VKVDRGEQLPSVRVLAPWDIIVPAAARAMLMSLSTIIAAVNAYPAPSKANGVRADLNWI
jgi:hypothetical protein